MLATPKDKKRLYLATSLCDGLEDNNIQQIIMLLMTKDADPNILVPNYGITPFHLVVGNDSETFAESVTKLFLQHSGNPNVKSIDGLTPVHVAAAWGRSKVLELLLANGGDPLCIDNDGRSPFHYAFDGKYYQAIATLSKFCNNSTGDDDKHKYNIKLDKILLSTGNLMAEYEPLKVSAYTANPMSDLNSDYEIDNLKDIHQNINVQRHVEDTKKKGVHRTFLGDKCSLLNHSSSIKTYKWPTAIEEKVRNLPTHSKYDLSPRACLGVKDQEQENFHINKSINSLCIPFAMDCINTNKWNLSPCSNESTCANCFHTLVSPNVVEYTKEQYKSLNIEKDDVNECRNTNYIGTRRYHKKITCKQSNIVLPDNKTPSKSYFDFGPGNSSRKKIKMIQANEERLLNTKTFTSKNSFVKCDHKREMTPNRNKHNSPSKYPNVKMNAHSTPRKKSKYFHMTCKGSKHSKHADIQLGNDSKKYTLNVNDEDKIKTMTTDTLHFNNSFQSDAELDFHISSDNELFGRIPNKRASKSSFAVNLNNGKYDEEEMCEHSVIQGNSHYSVDYFACQKDNHQAKHCFCKRDDLHWNASKLCDKCKGSVNGKQANKILQDQNPNVSCMLLKDKDFLENATKNFSKNQMLHECTEAGKKLHVAKNDEELSLYNLCLKENPAKRNIQSTIPTPVVKYNPCNISRMHTTTENSLSSSATNKTPVSIQQEYIYEDPEKGVVFLERRFCTPSSILDSTRDEEYHSAISEDSSTMQSVNHLSKELLMIDNETLRQKLMKMGDKPGPITATTKLIYLKRLVKLESKCDDFSPGKRLVNTQLGSDSIIMQPLLRFGKWLNDLPTYAELEKNTFVEFANPDQSRRWREGTAKTCFNYLLLDSRITQNLPNRNNLTEHDVWATFLSAIFYVGKGKRSRPYSHLYDAFNAWVLKDINMSSQKIKRILDIWNDGYGVVCLHIFQNIIPVEAYTREAAMIDALGLNNLDNCKAGEYYGIIATWSVKKKQKFGRYLLYRAMQIFLHEGERQLFPEHL